MIAVQLAARDQPVHDLGVDQRDDGVVVADQDQGGLLQPRQAGPADARAFDVLDRIGFQDLQQSAADVLYWEGVPDGR
jgi:hypothetical protein